MERAVLILLAFHESYVVYIYKARAREHNNMMQKLILNYTHLHEHTNTSMSMSASCVRTRIYIEDMRTKKVNECAVTSERIVFS